MKPWLVEQGVSPTLLEIGGGVASLITAKQQEPRVLAHLCFTLFNDPGMKDAYASGADLYTWVASKVYDMPYEECQEFRADGSQNPEGKERRSSCKSIILGQQLGRLVA